MEKKPSLLQFTMTNGAVLGIVLIIVSVLLYIMDFMPTSIGRIALFAIINYGIIIVFMVVGTKSYRNKILGGTITYGTAFLVGLLIVVFAAILSGFYTLIFTTLIDPGYMDRMYEGLMNWAYDFYANMGLPDSQIEVAMERFERQQANYTPLGNFFTGILASAGVGAVISLITSAFIKKNPVPFGMDNK